MSETIAADDGRGRLLLLMWSASPEHFGPVNPVNVLAPVHAGFSAGGLNFSSDFPLKTDAVQRQSE